MTSEYSLASDDDTPTPEPVGSEMVDMIRYPVLDEDYQSRHEKKVDIIHDCGPDNLCQSRLTAEGEAPEEHLFGECNKDINIFYLYTNSSS